MRLAISRALLAFSALTGETIAAAPAAKPEPISVESSVGIWEVTAPGGMSCRLHLREDRTGAGRGVGAPPACKQALPLLITLGSWAISGDNLNLVGTDGRVILAFGVPEVDGRRTAGLSGQTYALRPVSLRQRQPIVSEPIVRSGTDQMTKPVIVSARPVLSAAGAPVGPEAMAGDYRVLRSSGATGCKVVLGIDQIAPDRRRAMLDPGCADAGMIVFNPAAWRYEAGRLVIYAARGHDIALMFIADGSFRKDPPSGAELRLKRE